MRYVITALTMFAGFMLQTTLLQHIRIFGVLPNLAIALVVVFSVRLKMPMGICAAAAGGILQDLFFSPAFGMYTLIYLTVAFSVSAISGNFFEDSSATPIIMIAFATICQYLMMIVIYYFAGMQFNLSAIFLRMLLPELLMNAVLCWALYKIFGRILGRIGFESAGRWSNE
ncbi:MAG: rod shape-determining protein MreD [Clostridiales bacterium]|nr:MAG: rod shape-determining protein MreD [Clostridiales bacterium]